MNTVDLRELQRWDPREDGYNKQLLHDYSALWRELTDPTLRAMYHKSLDDLMTNEIIEGDDKDKSVHLELIKALEKRVISHPTIGFTSKLDGIIGLNVKVLYALVYRDAKNSGYIEKGTISNDRTIPINGGMIVEDGRFFDDFSVTFQGHGGCRLIPVPSLYGDRDVTVLKLTSLNWGDPVPSQSGSRCEIVHTVDTAMISCDISNVYVHDKSHMRMQHMRNPSIQPDTQITVTKYNPDKETSETAIAHIDGSVLSRAYRTYVAKQLEDMDITRKNHYSRLNTMNDLYIFVQETNTLLSVGVKRDEDLLTDVYKRITSMRISGTSSERLTVLVREIPTSKFYRVSPSNVIEVVSPKLYPCSDSERTYDTYQVVSNLGTYTGNFNGTSVNNINSKEGVRLYDENTNSSYGNLFANREDAVTFVEDNKKISIRDIDNHVIKEHKEIIERVVTSNKVAESVKSESKKSRKKAKAELRKREKDVEKAEKERKKAEEKLEKDNADKEAQKLKLATETIKSESNISSMAHSNEIEGFKLMGAGLATVTAGTLAVVKIAPLLSSNITSGNLMASGVVDWVTAIGITNTPTASIVAGSTLATVGIGAATLIISAGISVGFAVLFGVTPTEIGDGLKATINKLCAFSSDVKDYCLEKIEMVIEKISTIGSWVYTKTKSVISRGVGMIKSGFRKVVSVGRSVCSTIRGWFS